MTKAGSSCCWEQWKLLVLNLDSRDEWEPWPVLEGPRDTSNDPQTTQPAVTPHRPRPPRLRHSCPVP